MGREDPEKSGNHSSVVKEGGDAESQVRDDNMADNSGLYMISSGRKVFRTVWILSCIPGVYGFRL